MAGLYFAMLAGLSMGLWATFTKLASGSINATWAAVLISAVAALAALIKLAAEGNLAVIQTSIEAKVVFFIVLTGAMAFALDFFGLRAYDQGLPLNVGGPIIIGVGVLSTTIIGMIFLGESITTAKALGVLLILGGAVVLSR